jgi:ribosomal protein L1
MPSVATAFGKYLGPVGKMPAPGLGIMAGDDENSIKKELKKFDGMIKIKTKEPSIKLCIGKESMSDEDISENIDAVYKAVMKQLPRDKDNIRSVMVKFTMTKPKRINIE